MSPLAKTGSSDHQAALPSTRERILDAAEALFASRGFEGAAMRDIAADANLNPASLYNHFASKQALFEAVLERGLRPLFVVLDALELAGASSGNEVIERASHDIGDMVSKGSNLSAGFGMTGVFPETVVQMVATGEETGQLGEMLSSISDHFDDRVETSIEGLSSLIEPMMIVLIGGLIALILVAMFLPVFHLGGAIRRGHM